MPTATIWQTNLSNRAAGSPSCPPVQPIPSDAAKTLPESTRHLTANRPKSFETDGPEPPAPVLRFTALSFASRPAQPAQPRQPVPAVEATCFTDNFLMSYGESYTWDIRFLSPKIMSPPLTDNEEKTIASLRDGDRVDRASFFDRHRAALQQMARARIDPRLRRRLDDSDVMQEVFVKYCSEMETYLRDPQIPPLVWLRRIVRQTLYRLHRDHMETQCRDLRREVAEATSGNFTLDHLTESFSSVAKGLRRDELRRKLQDIFSRMSETDREILALVHIEDRTVREAAIELDIEMEAAKKRYHRALLKLRELHQSSLQEFLG